MLAYVISVLSNWLYTYILVALLLAAGLYFTLRTRFVQLRMFGESFRVLREEKHEEGGVSSFQALMISTASRVGTGNIAGVSIAICLGGVGAVFWMWLVALLGGASAFIESTLAQIYKVPDGNGGSRGGPAYYIEKVLGSRGLALLFSVFLILTYMVGFNMVASYNLMDSFSAYAFFSPARTPTVVGAVLAVLTALCIMGGSRRLSRVTGVLVPVMGGIYVQAALGATFGPAGNWFITVMTLFFAFTTILGNYYYCESNLHYILSREARKTELLVFRIIAVLIVFQGARLNFSLVWDTADVTMGFMALINLPSIVLLAKPALLALQDYTRQRREGKDPVFHAADIGLGGKTAYWN